MFCWKCFVGVVILDFVDGLFFLRQTQSIEVRRNLCINWQSRYNKQNKYNNATEQKLELPRKPEVKTGALEGLASAASAPVFKP